MEGSYNIPLSPFPQFHYWSEEENKLFDVLIADADLSSMDLFETIALQIPGKTANQVEEYFHSIIPKVDDISGNGLDNVSDRGKTIFVSNDDEAESSRRSIHRRRHHVYWTEKEHRLFVLGLGDCGRSWKNIARYFVRTKTPCQIASHAQKYFKRRNYPELYVGRRYSVLDIHTYDQSFRPKFKFAHYQPIAPFSFPPPPPKYQPQVDYNIFVGASSMPNKYLSASLFPTKDHYYFPQNVTNLPFAEDQYYFLQNVTNPPFDPLLMNNDNEAGPSMSYLESPSNYKLDKLLEDDFLNYANFMQ
ncbi:Transcription factor divaricata like [Thalictrum thalictroides]|uniref:Transcription factor divaricata like n=1 Tax=Thalictrum thalictroides TaxID=46969 RepID=A0A7J6XDN9_THATH|nr:Transcription factor divaricata like [Thalictrum thalictroides]